MKMLVAGTCAALVAVLGVQQFQLNRLTDDVSSIKEDLKFITQTNEKVSFTEKDEDCLARNIYYEAGVEGEKGKYAVAQTTINRLQTGRWGDSICKVVYAKAQFSWTLKKNLHKPTGQAWEDSQWIAHRILRGERAPTLKTALFYHADYVKPKWRDPFAKIQQIGAHIFYAKAKTKDGDA